MTLIATHPDVEALPSRRLRRHQRSERPDRAVLWSWLLLAAFAAVQVIIILQRGTGPSFDEGTYATAGLRTLEGDGIADNYLSWFAGSLLWPTLSGVGYELGGLVGTRFIALACVLVGLAGAGKAAGNLFGSAARLWTTAVLVTSGPILLLGHLGEYDALAAAGIGATLWCLTELNRRDDRRWLIAAGVASGVAILAKYPSVFVAMGPVALLAQRGRRARLDALLITWVLAGVMLAYFLPFRERLAQFPEFRAQNNPGFGLTLPTVAYRIALDVFPILVLSLAGLLLVVRSQRRLGVALISCLLVWPVYHVLIAGNLVGASKHVVFGFLCCGPLAGAALARLGSTRTRRALPVLVIAALAGFGAYYANALAQTWPDSRQTSAFLVDVAAPGDTFVINAAWPFRLALVDADIVDDPFKQVFDTYNLAHGQRPASLCSVDWVVEQTGVGDDLGPEVRAELAACGTFKVVFVHSERMRNPKADGFGLVTYTATQTVWANSAPTP